MVKGDIRGIEFTHATVYEGYVVMYCAVAAVKGTAVVVDAEVAGA